MIYLKNAVFIDLHASIFKRTNILVEEGLEGKITFTDEPQPEGTEVIDCTDKLVTGSFAVGHHHVYSALSRGMPNPQKQPENFYENLKYVWWTLDKALDKEIIEISALVTAAACAKAGSTFVIDHHSSPNSITGSLDTISEAFNRVGVSHLLCYEISDRDGLDKAKSGLDETDSYLQKNQALIGLHASFTLSDNTLSKAADLMEKYDSGIHIHVAEDRYDQDHCLINHSKRVVERLNDYGFLSSSKTILGHCLHLSDNEKKLIRESEAWVVQNIESNLKNKVGFFNGTHLGENIMLGTDGMHSDMIRSAQQVFFVGQNFERIPFEETYRRFRNVHLYIKQNNFKGDSKNNLLILDYKSPTFLSKENFLAHFIYGFNVSDILHVISDGKIIVKNKKLINVNENELLERSRELSLKLWKNMKK